MLAFALQGLSLGLSAAATPGPCQAFLIAQTLRNGWKRTLLSALAPLLSDGPIIALTLLILSRVPASFLRVVQIIGGVFVLYLAVQSYRSLRAPAVESTAPQAPQGSLLKAVLMNFLSPGPYLFWSLLAGPALLRGWQIAPQVGVSFVVGFYAALVGGMAAMIIVFGVARQVGPRLNRAMLIFSTLAMAAFGLYQLWQGILG